MQKYIKMCNKALWGLSAITLCLIIARMINPVFLEGYSEWNGPPGNIAVILFAIILIPGALQRLGVRNALMRYGIAWRRTMGIAMYFFGLMHFLFLLDFLPAFSDGLITSMDALTASGVTAMVLLLPVILTSNNWSVRFFKKKWKVLQRMTYLVIPLIAIHMWQVQKWGVVVVYALVTILVIFSYFYAAAKKN